MKTKTYLMLSLGILLLVACNKKAQVEAQDFYVPKADTNSTSKKKKSFLPRQLILWTN